MRKPFKGYATPLVALLFLCISAFSSQAQWTGPDGSGNIYNNNTGNVGIGTSTPRTNLEVNGYLSATTGLSVGASSFGSNIPANGFTLSFQNLYGVFTAGAGTGFGIKFRTSLTDRLVITDATVALPGAMHLLVGTSTDNGNAMQVNGNLWATGLVLPTGAAAGKVLTSDASGNATWQTAAASGSGWLLTGNAGVNPSTTFLGTTDNTPLPFRTGNNEHMRIDGTTGFVGIGTTTPQANLEAAGPVLGTTAGSISEMARMSASNGNGGQIRFQQMRFVNGTNWFSASTRIQGYTEGVAQAYMEFNPNGQLDGIAFGQGATEAMRLLATGQLLIGKTSQANSGYMLDVNGSGRLNQVVVNATGADYVFDPGYRLSSLHDLETYVTKEHHLPGIAPATQMQKDGLDLGDNQTRLLAKIEELTLYVIQEDKRNEALEEKIERLENQIQALKSPNH